MHKKLISVVLPVYNEEKNLVLLYDELSRILNQHIHYEYELIFVNDGSCDGSWDIIKKLAKHDERVQGILFSRNFGHQIALKAGYDHAQGDAIITMDTDLQHPPELIAHMIQAWSEGAYIVYVRNNNRNERFLKRLTATLYYRLLNYVTEVTIPRHVQDFRLIDKKVLNVIRHNKEKAPYWRGIVAWTGFQAVFLDCQFNERRAGITGYTWKKMFKLAFDGITSFSLFPLKLACFIGIFVIATGIGMFGYITSDALLNHIYYPLFKWLVTIIYIFIGVLFILLWLIGEYIGRMYETLQARPVYIVSEWCSNLTKQKNITQVYSFNKEAEYL